MKSTMILVVGATWLVACGAGAAEGDYGSSQAAVSSADQAGLLRFVNAPETTFERLDVDCALRSDSARNIIKHRNGTDKLLGTADDDPFETVEELDGVSMVGEWTMEMLLACAQDFGFVAPPLETCVPEPFEGPGDGDYGTLGYYRAQDLPPALGQLVTDLQEDAKKYAYPGRDLSLFPIRFAELNVYIQGDVTVGYVVRFVQTVDPEYGIQLHIRYTLDSCYGVRDVYHGI